MGWALAGPHRVDASHWVEYSWNPKTVTYTIDSTYKWHDEFDWNDFFTLRRKLTGWGQLWAPIEGLLDLGLDIALDMEYYFTIRYSTSKTKTISFTSGCSSNP